MIKMKTKEQINNISKLTWLFTVLNSTEWANTDMNHSKYKNKIQLFYCEHVRKNVSPS